MAPELDDILHFVDPDETPLSSASLTDDEWAVLEAVNTQIGARQSLDEVLAFLAESLRPISPCDRFSLAFVEEPGRRVVSRYTRAFYETVRLRTGYAEDLVGSTLEQVLATGHVRIIGDLPRYLELWPHSRSTKLLVQEGVQSSMTCPLYVDDRPVGLLFRSARQPRAYDAHQVHVHLAVADRLGQVVEKAWRIEQLAQANQAYFEMLGFVTHELKSPIGSMLTEAGLLRDGYVGEITPDQRARLEKLMHKGQYLLTLINEYLNLSRLEGGEMQLSVDTDVDIVADVIEPAIRLVSTPIDEQGMQLERIYADNLPLVEVDPNLLTIVVVNLLSNAVRYGRPQGRIRVQAAFANDRLRLVVWNEGPGFPPGQRHRLFRRFSRLQTPELKKRKGTGVGLYTSWRIVRLHSGRMDADSEPDQWAEFSCEIPQPLPPGVKEQA